MLYGDIKTVEATTTTTTTIPKIRMTTTILLNCTFIIIPAVPARMCLLCNV